MAIWKGFILAFSLLVAKGSVGADLTGSEVYLIESIRMERSATEKMSPSYSCKCEMQVLDETLVSKAQALLESKPEFIVPETGVALPQGLPNVTYELRVGDADRRILYHRTSTEQFEEAHSAAKALIRHFQKHVKPCSAR